MNSSFLAGAELLAIGKGTLAKANRRFLSCHQCDSEARTAFALILEDVIGESDRLAEYLLSEAAKCPKCAKPVYETTLVRPDAEFESTLGVERVFEPPIEETDFVFVDESTLQEAQSHIVGCEHCDPQSEISLDYILDELTGCNPTVTEYILCRPTSCPLCFSQVTEKTLIVPV